MPKRNLSSMEGRHVTLDAEKRRKVHSAKGQADIGKSSDRVLSNGDYTVGWICAITAELVAARAFLDEQHEAPKEVTQNDNNNYILGKIGPHNVVIAVLPQGECGPSSAATVARDMLHSFPNIRIGLMVGVGGGAPSQKHDIRLGDIVVSSRGGGNGGVLQYDYGKTIQNSSFVETGFLNQPPQSLLTAVNTLEATYEMQGHQLDNDVEMALKNIRSRKKYCRPHASTDRLFRPSFTHPQNSFATCSQVCSDDLAHLLTRAARDEDENNPMIHYGLIASANTLMEDAILRDTLAAERNVLCFEREAAGLMNHFPCLVIRGICHYSDTHKNEDWQGFAAMMAAAYAKDLLRQIPPKKLEAETRIGELLSDVLNKLSTTEANVETVKSRLKRQEDLEILNWLTPLDYGPQHSDFLKRRQQGTGNWLLDSPTFQTWLNTDKQTLFCPGIPGAGKTILISIVIDHLSTRFPKGSNVGIAYLYCNFQRQHEQTIEHFLASLLKQLVQELSSIPEGVKRLYDRHKDKSTRASCNELSKTLRSLLSDSKIYTRTFIIIDAVDECSKLVGCQKQLLSEVFSLRKQTGTNLFATSRFSDEIAERFDGAQCMKIHATKGDLATYLNEQMNQQPDVFDRDIRYVAVSKIVRAADGMFLLAQLHMNTLIGLPTKGDVKDVLRSLAKGQDGLDETYKSAMQRIESQGVGYRELAKKILAWIVQAKRPLSTLELRHALAVRPSPKRLDHDFISAVGILQSVCTGLVTVDEESEVIRLVHYTTQEYFERTWLTWFPDAHKDMTIVCVTYLSFDIFGSGVCQTDDELRRRYQEYPLFDYAALCWADHAGKLLNLPREVIDFLECETKVQASGQAITDRSDWGWYILPSQITGLHLAAYFGVEKAVEPLLRTQTLKLDGHGQTPLFHAVLREHREVVELLLANGDANVKNSDGWTPLGWAAKNGHEVVVQLLLAKDGVDVNFKDSYDGMTPLLDAAKNGHEAIAQLLLAKDELGINFGDAEGTTALLYAVQGGDEAVVQLLLGKHGVDVNAAGKKGYTPLLWAIHFRHRAIYQLLLIHGGVDVNTKWQSSVDDGTEWQDGWTALLFAVFNEDEVAVQLLLAIDGVDVNAKSSLGLTPLSCAAVDGNKEIVQLLLARDGVDINARDNEGLTPLLSAVSYRNKEIVQLLLAKDGVDINAKDDNGWSPLLWAAHYGDMAVTRLLLSKDGIDVEAEDNAGKTPLLYAAMGNYEEIVELLKPRPI